MIERGRLHTAHMDSTSPLALIGCKFLLKCFPPDQEFALAYGVFLGRFFQKEHTSSSGLAELSSTTSSSR